MKEDIVARYTELSGNNGEHTSLAIIGAFLDGYDAGRDQGLTDAWKGAYTVWNMIEERRDKIFGTTNFGDVLDSYTPEEVLKKIKEADDIKIGDEIYNTFTRMHCIIVSITGDKVYGLFGDGSCGVISCQNYIKSGKHYDLSNILLQINESDEQSRGAE